MALSEWFWPLHPGLRTPAEPAGPARTHSATSLYARSLQVLVSKFADNPRCVRQREDIAQLPLPMRLDALYDMCEHPALADALLQLLSDPPTLADLLEHVQRASERLICCLQWLECSGRRSLPAQLVRNFETGRPHYHRGLLIGTFLVQAGWLREAVTILQLTRQQVDAGSKEELEVLRQLLKAETLFGKLDHARTTYELIGKRMKGRCCSLVGRWRNLVASVYETLSLYHYERREFALAYLRGIQSLKLLDRSSPSRLVLEVFRQLARACLACQVSDASEFLHHQALARSGSSYGVRSVPYAEALEDYALYLLAQNRDSDGASVHTIAQSIYLELYGVRNLQMAIAQGQLAFGLCRQARALGRREDALAHFTQRMASFERILSPEHRLVVQLRRLLVTMEVMLFREDQSEGTPVGGSDQSSLMEGPAEQPLPVDDVRRALHRFTRSRWGRKKDPLPHGEFDRGINTRIVV